MSTSFPYLTLARESGADYGAVLLASDFLTAATPSRAARDAWVSLDGNGELQARLFDTARRERVRQIRVERGGV